MRPTAPVLVAGTTIILVLVGLPVVWMRPSGKQHTGPKDNVWLLNDVKPRSFFVGISEIDKRSKPPSSFDRALSTLEHCSLSHFLGLSPLTTSAQNMCNGAYNST